MDQDLKSWDSGAADYISVASGTDEFKEEIDDPAFLTLLGDIQGKRILDIGCGDGSLCKKLRKHGAETVGIDGSPRMIELAKANDPPGTYKVANVMEPLPFTDAAMDLVTAKMMLMNIASVEMVAKNIYAALKPGGLFAIDVVHPFRPLYKSLASADSTPKTVDNYFREKRGTVGFAQNQYTFYYRPLNHYVNEVITAGFRLFAMNEIGVDAAFAQKYPAHQSKVNQPVSLHMLFGK